MLQTVHCHSQPKTPVKRRLLEISRKGTLPNIPCTCQIFRQSCNTQKFLLLYWKVISSQTLSQQFWSFSEQTKKKIVVESVFGIVISGWIGKLEFFKRNAIKDGVFFFIFQNFITAIFPRFKISEEIFLLLHYIIDLSLANFQLFHNTQRKHFSWSLHLKKSETLDCRAVALEKKGDFRKYFFGISETLEHSFLSEHSQNVSVVQHGSRRQTIFVQL